MSEERCGRCRFWPLSPYGQTHPEMESGIAGPSTDGTVSDCRRHAPRELNASRYPHETAQWPKTHRGEWCGDFEPRM